MMRFAPFHERFPQIGADECRFVYLPDAIESIPAGQYSFVEHFCADKDCDCRRGILVVVNSQSGKPMATIGYGFDRQAPFAGPYLDPLNKQSRQAEDFLELAKELLFSDRHYVSRLEKHYRMFKAVLRGEKADGGAVLSPEEVQERIAERKSKRQWMRQFKKTKQTTNSTRRLLKNGSGVPPRLHL